MVAAREAFLGAGPLPADQRRCRRRRASGTWPRGPSGIVLDLAGGTGAYLAVVLDRLPDRHGLVVDLSKPALQRAAGCIPASRRSARTRGAGLPLADASVSAVLNIFGPRNGAEIARVLAPGGVLVSVTPTAEHLHELVGPLGMLRVDERKAERLAGVAARLHPGHRTELRFTLDLDHAAVAEVVGMGPTADHVEPEALARRIASLPLPTTVTARRAGQHVTPLPAPASDPASLLGRFRSMPRSIATAPARLCRRSSPAVWSPLPGWRPRPR